MHKYVKKCWSWLSGFEQGPSFDPDLRLLTMIIGLEIFMLVVVVVTHF